MPALMNVIIELCCGPVAKAQSSNTAVGLGPGFSGVEFQDADQKTEVAKVYDRKGISKDLCGN